MGFFSSFSSSLCPLLSPTLYWHIMSLQHLYNPDMYAKAVRNVCSIIQCKMHPQAPPFLLAFFSFALYTSVWKSPSWTSKGKLTHFSHSAAVISSESLMSDSSTFIVA